MRCAYPLRAAFTQVRAAPNRIAPAGYATVTRSPQQWPAEQQSAHLPHHDHTYARGAGLSDAPSMAMPRLQCTATVCTRAMATATRAVGQL